MPLFLQSLLANAHSGTWFSVKRSEERLLTRGGSLPGDPLGDLVFNFLMAHILRQLHARLRNSGLSVHKARNGDEVQHSTGLVEIPTSEYGVAINLSEGKTECIVSLCGNGSRMLNIQCDGGTVDLRIAPTYRRLGGVVANRGDWAPEFRAGAASMWSEITPQIRAVLRDIRAPLARRYSIVESLYLLAVLRCWHLDTPHSEKSIVQILQRPLAGRPYPHGQ